MYGNVMFCNGDVQYGFVSVMCRDDTFCNGAGLKCAVMY